MKKIFLAALFLGVPVLASLNVFGAEEPARYGSCSVSMETDQFTDEQNIRYTCSNEDFAFFHYPTILKMII